MWDLNIITEKLLRTKDKYPWFKGAEKGECQHRYAVALGFFHSKQFQKETIYCLHCRKHFVINYSSLWSYQRLALNYESGIDDVKYLLAINELKASFSLASTYEEMIKSTVKIVDEINLEPIFDPAEKVDKDKWIEFLEKLEEVNLSSSHSFYYREWDR